MCFFIIREKKKTRYRDIAGEKQVSSSGETAGFGEAAKEGRKNKTPVAESLWLSIGRRRWQRNGADVGVSVAAAAATTADDDGDDDDDNDEEGMVRQRVIVTGGG